VSVTVSVVVVVVVVDVFSVSCFKCSPHSDTLVVVA
jgi:hypothetical protein